MQQRIAQITIVVKDYNEAIEFYTQKLHFTLLEDTVMSETKRWVVVAPPGSTACTLLLAKAANEAQTAAVGNQTGGRVGFFLYTDNVLRDYQDIVAKGVAVLQEPTKAPYGTVVVFADLYGNRWDLIEPI